VATPSRSPGRRRFRTLAVDLYGCERSPDWPGDQPLSLADEVALLEPVLAATGARFHLIGHSYGGGVALKVALAHPGWLASLVVFEPVLFSLLMAQDPDQPHPFCTRRGSASSTRFE
jgi:pimeloyl-ACP methyl ester carboxylesterase